MTRYAIVAALALSVVSLAGCGSGGASAGCGSARREALDPNLSHILGSAPTPTYLTDPPTSGPHEPTRVLSGVQREPIPKPVQVGLLEAGTVIVQYKDISNAQAEDLDALAGNDVVVAPADELPTPIVATAWLYKQTCRTVDTPALRAFVTAHAGKGPGFDG